MSQCPVGLVAASLVALAVFAPGAAAQPAPPARVAAETRGLSFGGDIAAVIGRKDTDAFFNYTDYEHNALRIARVRLSGEWRLGRGLSLIGEAQTENGETPEATAAYLRWRPRRDRGLVLQAGRIPPVVGAFSRRAYGRDNPLIGSPLAYQYLASIRPDALPATIDDLLRMRGRGWQSSFPIGSSALRPGVPLMSPRWDTGVEAGWRHDRVELSTALTVGAPSIPRTDPTNAGRAWSGRAAVHQPSGVVLGVSGARGSWMDRAALDLVAADRRQSAQSLVGADVECGRGPWLVRGEWLRSVFEVPIATGLSPVAHLSATAAFAEARYRLRPRWQLAARVERLAFSAVRGTLNNGQPTSWDAPVRRVELVAGFRVQRQVEVRGGWQHDWRDGGRVRARGYPVLQALMWF
jgi:hypothetical protein